MLEPSETIGGSVQPIFCRQITAETIAGWSGLKTFFHPHELIQEWLTTKST
jgi:hypothetical protein